MDHRLKTMLESLLMHVEVLNSEIDRLCRCEQFSPTTQSFQLLERIRGSCTTSLQTVRTVERALYRSQPPSSTTADIFRLDDDS